MCKKAARDGGFFVPDICLVYAWVSVFGVSS